MATISTATARNWARLNSSKAGRLASRANKTESKRKVSAKAYATINDSEALVNALVGINAPTGDIMYSLCNTALQARGLADKPHVKAFMSRFDNQFAACPISLPDIDFKPENDVLGFIYQSLLTEGERNRNGIYYTAANQVRKVLEDIHIKSDQTFLDPCCGSGAFLVNADADNPYSLFGFDIDPIAVMLAGVNLIIRYADKEFLPQVYVYDFLDRGLINRTNYPVAADSFDFVFTNPPWGADRSGIYRPDFPEIKSSEKASMAIVEAIRCLVQGGVAGFLLPKSMLGVDTHADIRRFLLTETAIKKIVRFNTRFDGVFTDYFSITVENNRCSTHTYCVEETEAPNGKKLISIPALNNDASIPTAPTSEIALSISGKVKARKHDSLAHSKWALGIVTGDNKRKLSDSPLNGSEPIYTGKQVAPFRLEKSAKYVRFQPAEFQQCAPEAIYRAPEKLIYRFIAPYPIVSYDDSGAITLNSANIIVPEVDTLSAKSVCALLNSSLYRFLYIENNNDIKVLKKNLLGLTFPKLSALANDELSQLCDEARSAGLTDEIKTRLDNLVYSLFEISPAEKQYIKDKLSRWKN